MLLDRLRRPIKVGDTVVTKPYGSPGFYLVTTVLKVNRKSIIVASNHRTYSGNYSYNGKWESKTTEHTSLKRSPNDVIVITEQLAYNKENFPEAYL